MQEFVDKLHKKRTSFLNWIELNVDDEKVLKAAIEYFDLEEKVRKANLLLAEIDLAASRSIETENKNLDLVISHYNIDRVFNKDKSEKWLVKALKLVIVYKYTFDGIKFSDGKETYLKTTI